MRCDLIGTIELARATIIKRWVHYWVMFMSVYYRSNYLFCCSLKSHVFFFGSVICSSVLCMLPSLLRTIAWSERDQRTSLQDAHVTACPTGMDGC